MSVVPERPYLREQLITCIGNKRALLPFIATAVERVRRELSRETLAAGDFFSGSGIAARYLKGFAHRLVVNDLEYYSEVINRCYLSNRDDRHGDSLQDMYADLMERLDRAEREDTLDRGTIATVYAPARDDRILPGERVFYTSRNARYIDTARRLVGELPREVQHFFLAPLLAEASVHTNTSGVFKGFYKDRRTGIGRFGGSGENALTRITGEIRLPFPLFSDHDCPVEVYREDANDLARRLAREVDAGSAPLDLVYLDPPYNQHPYGSNYFMLNVIARGQPPQEISTVSGIPRDWNRSRYNSVRDAAATFSDLVTTVAARYLLVSFNDEGFLSREMLLEILRAVGTVETMETRYNTFRGSRNLRNRAAHVRELLFLVRVNRFT